MHFNNKSVFGLYHLFYPNTTKIIKTYEHNYHVIYGYLSLKNSFFNSLKAASKFSSATPEQDSNNLG